MLDFLKKKNVRKDPKKLSREELIAQAQQNARKAREELGEENIRRLAEALQQMNSPAHQSEGKRAQEKIRQMDKGHIADNLKIILKEDK
ncbi:MAG: hypothetical protein CO093_03010 [Alphaproteobacteria bacterium CG_4_9_14_3_um_filter_47_13]|nr:MAG: hypothetical protein CO093_03010 [Alphaproteobacteria bacterium CG_4_9_14_3_um_filter_47_13]